MKVKSITVFQVRCSAPEILEVNDGGRAKKGSKTYLLLLDVIPGERLALCDNFLAIRLGIKDCGMNG